MFPILFKILKSYRNLLRTYMK